MAKMSKEELEALIKKIEKIGVPLETYIAQVLERVDAEMEKKDKEIDRLKAAIRGLEVVRGTSWGDGRPNEVSVTEASLDKALAAVKP